MLLLWDIDGTMLRGAAGAHREALLRAVREVHDVDARDLEIETAGRTDAWITRAVLVQAGVGGTVIDEGAGAVRDAACRIYRTLCEPSLADHVVPGVTEALQALSGEHLMSLVTGNYEDIAHHKLGCAGIGSHFARGQGGFGSDHEDRAHLPAIARARAGGHARADTVVIGDTPHDVACARADGVRCIAVTTGPFAARDLGGADVVIAGAAELPTVLAQMVG